MSGRAGARRARIALLFDLDGTLVDTDHLHLASFQAVLADIGGAPLGLADYRAHVMGHPNPAIAAFLFPDDPRAEALIDRKEQLFRAGLDAVLPPVAGVHALLDWADAEGAGVAVVTNAPRANAEAMLAAAGLAERLPALVIGDECARPKPDPAPYLEAMRRLGATPDRSIAFEDSRSGLRAARAAGARTFGLTTGLDAAALLQAGAHHVIPDFTAPALWSALRTLKAQTA